MTGRVSTSWCAPHKFDVLVYGEHSIGEVTSIVYEGSPHDPALQLATNYVAVDESGHISDVRLMTEDGAVEWLLYRYLRKRWGAVGSISSNMRWWPPYGPCLDQETRRFVLGERY